MDNYNEKLIEIVRKNLDKNRKISENMAFIGINHVLEDKPELRVELDKMLNKREGDKNESWK